MKKLFTTFLTILFCATLFAADLNPFAYGLSSSVNATDPMRLDIEFKLNAPATSVKVYVYEVGGDWSLLVDAHLVEENRTYTGWIDLSTIPAQYRGGNKNLNWRVDVTGSEVTSMTFVQNDVKLYAPTSIDIDNNPENANFGTVFCVEGLDYPYNRSGYESYISYHDGAGLYVLDPDGSPRLMPYQGTKVRYGYNGGVLAEHNTERQYYVKGNNKTGAYSPYRVRVADDGRIFVTSLTPPRYMNGDSVMQVLWEAKKECFSAESESEWRANTGWTKVISSSNANTNVQLTKADKSSFTYGDIYNLYTNDGQFITAPNIGFDVRGGGDALQLLMLSASKQAIALNTAGYYRCCEYDLGSSTIYSRKADRPIFDGYVVFYTDPQVEYDKDGNRDVHEVVPLGITLDERIADGYYYSGTVALVKELLEPVAVAPRHKAQRNVNIPRQRKARNHGHSVRHAKQYDAIVSLNQLTQAFEAGSVIRIDTLKSMGIVPADADGYKVLVSDNEKADRPLIIHATSFSSLAKQAIIEAGGQAIKVYH